MESIPGLREAGWRAAARQTRVAKLAEEPADPDTLATALRNILNAVSVHFLISLLNNIRF